ncbi:MAG TPA: nitroreductase/quinone reductase family protein [Propionibacteriaceae bacterium]|nr:nitroreductase/quinone reductase family protein [Propionibacteriaceae bacterium]
MRPGGYLKRRMARIGNQIGVWMYRAFDGRLASYNKGAKVLMITSPGRRTGVLHSTCVRYLETPKGYVVWGTASGAPSDPDWFRNLRKAKTADVQIGANTLQVRPRELLAGERDATWRNVVLAEAPEVEKIAKRAGRTIPVALLQPVEAPPRRAKVD